MTYHLKALISTVNLASILGGYNAMDNVCSRFFSVYVIEWNVSYVPWREDWSTGKHQHAGIYLYYRTWVKVQKLSNFEKRVSVVYQAHAVTSQRSSEQPWTTGETFFHASSELTGAELYILKLKLKLNQTWTQIQTQELKN